MSRKRILILEDDERPGMSLAPLLIEWGCEVDAVSTIGQAKLLLEENIYEVVISDNRLDNHDLSGDDFLLDNKALMKSAKKAILTWRYDPIKRVGELARLKVRIIQRTSLTFFQDLQQIVIEEFDKQESSDEEFVAFALFGDKIKLVSITLDGTYKFLDEWQNLHNIVYTVSSEVLALQSAVDELESMVNNPVAKEMDFQDFFERNPKFIINDVYKKAHSHIVLTTEDGQSLIPDFVLEPVDQNSLCDILELKLPSAEVFVLKKNRERFSSAVSEARAQLLEYSRFFNERTNRDAIYQKYGLRSWMPKMFLIIGRLGTIDPYKKRKIEAAQPDLHLLTYDDVISRVKSRIERMKRGGLDRS